ncbi:retinitis pigmentosa 1-like 1 protein [Mixophyes fleayi]|uniref:retinitis pigmentosa 1-like 1 protein n=1 Tax=Mixophyes fleayi TaxID=3061075 RepID=UPI003F4DC0A0
MNLAAAEGHMASQSSSEQRLPPVARPHAVSEVTPAKKITFFKSGDPQFSGVKMAISRRSFKSFSALMDDLSNRVPLPFGVRTITTPRGTHSINRLEQLQDGGRYICSDKKYVQPIAGRKMVTQRASRPVSGRKQGQQEDQEEENSSTHFQQVPKPRKKIVLVKNGDPTVRRSVILNRRNTRNFRTFLEDASDLLQYTVRRLYTVDGSRIENIQALLQSPSILLCVGREAFKPLQTDNVHKSITEKLPGLRSHPSNNTEVMDNKKNANFGLKAKKSVIHPRSASSNKTRFSLSSEKSYPNGLNMSPVNSGFDSYPNTCPHGKSEDTGHSLVNDDIEKKVHVNKDGSLSVEMKVRFRLLNEETLQWSTQIKKSSTFGKAKCEQLCLCDENGKKEDMIPDIFSETDDSFYPCDADSYSSKLNDAELEDMYCSHCGMQCQEYDIWKNPMHTNQQEDYVKRSTWQTRSSASSTSSHHKLMCDQKTSIDSLHTMSSEEYTEHIVHKSSHYSESRENGETMVRYSTVSRCTNCSGQSTTASNVDAISDTGRKKTGDSQHKSRSSLKSPTSLQSQQSQHSEGQHDLKRHGGSFEESIETSPSPCLDGENCSQRVSVVSQSSLHSRKSRRMLKRNSTDPKSFGSNISYNEEEEKDQLSGKASLKNMQDMSTETKVSEDHRRNECTEQSKSPNDNEIPVEHNNDGPLKSSHSDCDKCSTVSSSHSRSFANEKTNICSQNDHQSSCSSPSLSSISKQNTEKALCKNVSIDTSENNVQGNKSTSSKSKRSSYTENQGQSIQSNSSRQSMSSVAKSASSCSQEECQILNHQESCNESSKTHHTDKPEDCTTATSDEDGQASLPISRSSSKSQSLSSTYNCVSCLENDKVFSVSSRVSSVSEKKSRPLGSSEICGQNSSKDGARDTSQVSEKQNHHNQDADTGGTATNSEANCIYSPSPPKGKPANRHLRSTQFKYSNGSIGSDPMKTTNGEKTDSSRSSTPVVNGILASRASTETCKNTKKSVTTHNSAEDIQNIKKRKNSSSSSKRKQKGESLDNGVSGELIPSALPNVTPEEVVNEWLRKIPSQTMVVEYEMEECQKQVCTEVENDILKTDIEKEQEDGEKNKDSITDTEDSGQVKEKVALGVCCLNSADNALDTNICDKKENEDFMSRNTTTNNVKCGAATVESTCDKKSLPNNIQTSVQIMKALLSPSPDSKFDRSNSLPEVSQTMGRKLSNSAKVLISCLASLKLLDEGPTDPTKNSNDLNKMKYIELLNIFQALWAEGPTNKITSSITSGKHYIREDEITPVSSSGVDINSGYGGSGDGSITGGGDNTMIAEKSEDSKLSTVTKEVECASKNIQNCGQEPVTCGDQDTGDGQQTTEALEACFDDIKSCVMDENMNEKKIDRSDNNLQETMQEEYGNSDTVNNVNDECIENLEAPGICSNDTMNILNHSVNTPKSNESNSSETNYIKSPSNCRSTVISTSDSNGENGPIICKQVYADDPVWVLKLLKKIEKEFMTHYVDAMNEFKVRWNLEDKENLDEMIAELKNEVSQRIERSISNELKRIKSRTGTKVPRPPDESTRRKSSLQAEERRRRLQTMHRRSIHHFESRDNKDGGTNYISCETDEEDLTFSASFGDESSGQPNDEFCPCDKCIKLKRALKLANPRAVVADAPIIKAFDLQQILKMKKENNNHKIDNNDEAIVPSQEEGGRDVEPSMGNDCSAENEEDPSEGYTVSKTGDEIMKATSDISSDDNEPESQEDRSVVDECEVCASSDFQCNTTHHEIETEPLECNPEVEDKSTECLGDELENANSDEMNKSSVSVIIKEMSVECPTDDQTTAAPEEENQNEHEHCSEEPLVDSTRPLTSNHEETNETSESGDEPDISDAANGATDELSENEDCIENITNTRGDVQENDTETFVSGGSYFQKSLAQGSLITQNGSTDDADAEDKEINNNLGETSPNGQSNSSGSKQSQMYPASSSEDEDGDTPSVSPVGISKNENIDQLHVNNIGSFEECDNKSEKNLNEDIIDQDDLDF